MAVGYIKLPLGLEGLKKSVRILCGVQVVRDLLVRLPGVAYQASLCRICGDPLCLAAAVPTVIVANETRFK